MLCLASSNHRRAKIAIVLLLMALASVSLATGCSSRSSLTSSPPAITKASPATQVSMPPAPTPGIASGKATAPAATPLQRPPAGKPQELTLTLKQPANTFNGIIFLSNNETLLIDWKYLGGAGSGAYLMFTTPEGREMDANSKPLNIAGHPLYDANLPSQSPTEQWGGHSTIQVGKSNYCGEGYYNLVFSAPQEGTIFLRYSLASISK
jgi:hypothetical protein